MRNCSARSAAVHFTTDLMHLAASTMAAIYKDRWPIELLFKALKQRFRIKTFVNTSANAVQIQNWTAQITMRYLKFLQLTATWTWSLSDLATLLYLDL